jgi:hypothetical protein
MTTPTFAARLAEIKVHAAAVVAFRASFAVGDTVGIRNRPGTYRVLAIGGINADSRIKVIRLRAVPVSRGAGSAWKADEVGNELTYARVNVMPAARG